MENNTTNADKNNKFLLEEYKQVYQQLRHTDKIDDSKEAIFAIAAFGILALVISKDLSVLQLFGAMIVSVSLYSYQHFSRNRIAFFTKVAQERLKDIERIINPKLKDRSKEILDKNEFIYNICFQTETKHYIGKVKELPKPGKQKPTNIAKMGKRLLYVLIFLWVFIIIYGFYQNKSKDWNLHKQTKQHRHYR